jgi:hypothetical protein
MKAPTMTEKGLAKDMPESARDDERTSDDDAPILPRKVVILLMAMILHLIIGDDGNIRKNGKRNREHLEAKSTSVTMMVIMDQYHHQTMLVVMGQAK